MYASTTDYKNLYTSSYFGKRAGATSFAPNPFTKELLAFCSAQGLRYVVDIGSGSGALAAILRHADIKVLTCDFDPVDADGIHFDLSGPISGAMRVLEAIEAQTGGESWLVTCLDVLEHLDAEDVFAAVRNLRAVCPAGRSHLIASISTRPSSADNKYHATILPKPTWLEILKAVGFAVDKESIFPSARAVRREFPESDELKLVSYWAKCDLFGDVCFGEPDYVLLSAGRAEIASEDAAQRHVEAVLDIAFRREKRLQFNAGLAAHENDEVRVPRVALNLHFVQEFILYRLLLDVLPRSSVVVLVRTSVLEADALALARGFFARCGVQAIFYERCTEIAWRELNLRFLITGAESNVTCHHVMGRQIVEAAKLYGVHTIQMQHGIWIEQFPQRLIEFGSETIWAWSPQYESFTLGSQVSLAGKVVHGRRQPWQSFDVVGSPKFVDMRLSPPLDLVRWRLGRDTSKYRAVALLGTNLLWHRHGTATKTVREGLGWLIRSTPDVLFIVKLHPSERASGAAELVQPNSIVLDDVLIGVLDLHVTRLVAAVDIVISSLSTLLLDAAVGGKPCVQYNTENDLSYQGLASVEIEQLPQILMNISAIPINVELVQEYAGAFAEPFYEHLARKLAAWPPSSGSRAEIEEDAASYYSVATGVEDLWSLARQVQSGERAIAHELQRVQSTADALSSDNARMVTQLDALKAELEVGRADAAAACAREIAKREEIIAVAKAATAELVALQRSRSWRLTAPLRSVRRLFGV